MKYAVVGKPYRRPYADPIRVRAGEFVVPDFSEPTDIPGWVWCTDARGKSGWTPKSWLARSGNAWVVTRDFDAIELTIEIGDEVLVHFEESGFYWVATTDGRRGWIPVECLEQPPA